MNFYLKIDNEQNNINIINDKIILERIDKEKYLLFKKYYKTVSLEKEKIDKLENNENWDKMKKIGNPYELVYTTYNKRRKNDSISSYIPISRSYFKLWEIFHNFDLFKYFNVNNDLIFSHLAEGPGGFMEASYNYRSNIKNKNKKINNDIYYGITLKPTNDFIPDWNKIKKNFNNKNNIIIEYGNLYYLDDIKKYINYFTDKKAHFVTADGGFDYSGNFNGQEINSCQIIYSECITALNILEVNGCFVCKVFDLFSVLMVQILYILSLSFEKVFIYKPDTSRPANSEKYLICMYYKNNLSDPVKNNLLKIIDEWNNITYTLTDNDSIILKNIKIDNNFIKKLDEYNEKYMETQLFYLNNTIKLAENKIEKEQYYDIIQKQVSYAINWCIKYNIEINKNSIYYKKNINP
jgi:23S rRNA U2552 (ribose-2'-O)-methylase RlmE/FtsJ